MLFQSWFTLRNFSTGTASPFLPICIMNRFHMPSNIAERHHFLTNRTRNFHSCQKLSHFLKGRGSHIRRRVSVSLCQFEESHQTKICSLAVNLTQEASIKALCISTATTLAKFNKFLHVMLLISCVINLVSKRN